LGLGLLVWGVPTEAKAHGDVHDQIVALTEEIQRSPTNAELYVRRGELQRVHGDYDSAQADYEHAFLLNPALPTIDLLRSRVFLEAGWPVSAEALADRVVKKYPTHSEGLLIRARARAKQGKGEAAAADYTTAIGLMNQPGPELYVERARALTELGPDHWTVALKGLDEGVQKLGPLVTLQLYAVDLEVKQQKYDAALKRLDLLASKSPRKETWLARRGEILVSAGRPKEARAEFVAAREAIGKLPPARRQVPALIELEKRLHDAIEALDRDQKAN
jgi:predicted Zn-dependent protease